MGWISPLRLVKKASFDRHLGNLNADERDVYLPVDVDLDRYVVETVEEIGIEIDKEELLKALEYDRDQYVKGYHDRDRELIRCRECKCARKSLLFKGKLLCRRRPGAFFYTAPYDFCSCGRHKS